MRAAVLTGLLLLGIPGPAAAHDAGSTLVTVSPGYDDVGLTAQIPLSRLDFAYHTRLADDPERSVGEARGWLTATVLDRVTLTGPDGREWPLRVDSIIVDRLEGFDTARVELTGTPPAGARRGPADLRWRVVGDAVYTHKVFIGRHIGANTEVTGVITRQRPVARIPVTALGPPPRSEAVLGAPGWLAAMVVAVALGVVGRYSRARPRRLVTD
ncbi:hypothetical protein [Actinoplanes philippinensis]|uniref:hypothetical protein n=1 Tax=Actinoplanes philippinensis TaxID=35752 RepID=UPI0033F1E773